MRRRLTESINLYLPKGGIGDDGTWIKKREVAAPPLGACTMNLNLRLQGEENIDGRALTKVGITGKALLTPLAGAATGPITFRQKAVAGDNAQGTVLFDSAKGRLATLTFRAKLAGDATANVAGTTMTGEMSMEIDQVIRVLDSLPE
jgi:hypothetical protein